MMFDEVFFFTCDMIDFSRMKKKNWIEIELSWKEYNNRRHINLFSGSMLGSAFDFGYVSSEIHSNWNNFMIWYNKMRSTILYDIIYRIWYDMLHDKYWKLKCSNYVWTSVCTSHFHVPTIFKWEDHIILCSTVF